LPGRARDPWPRRGPGAHAETTPWGRRSGRRPLLTAPAQSGIYSTPGPRARPVPGRPIPRGRRRAPMPLSGHPDGPIDGPNGP